MLPAADASRLQHARPNSTLISMTVLFNALPLRFRICPIDVAVGNGVSSVDKALRHFSAKETLDEKNKWKCPRCKKAVRAVKQLTIRQPPAALTIHLKRFSFTPKYNAQQFGGNKRAMQNMMLMAMMGGGQKLTAHIEFPEKLDISPALSDAAIKTGVPSKYDLHGVLVHQGHSSNSGHYYSYVKAPNGQWACMNDETVTNCSYSLVAKTQAYMLFYSRSPGQLRGGDGSAAGFLARPSAGLSSAQPSPALGPSAASNGVVSPSLQSKAALSGPKPMELEPSSTASAANAAANAEQAKKALSKAERKELRRQEREAAAAAGNASTGANASSSAAVASSEAGPSSNKKPRTIEDLETLTWAPGGNSSNSSSSVMLGGFVIPLPSLNAATGGAGAQQGAGAMPTQPVVPSSSLSLSLDQKGATKGGNAGAVTFSIASAATTSTAPLPDKFFGIQGSGKLDALSALPARKLSSASTTAGAAAAASSSSSSSEPVRIITAAQLKASLQAASNQQQQAAKAASGDELDDNLEHDDDEEEEDEEGDSDEQMDEDEDDGSDDDSEDADSADSGSTAQQMGRLWAAKKERQLREFDARIFNEDIGVPQNPQRGKRPILLVSMWDRRAIINAHKLHAAKIGKIPAPKHMTFEEDAEESKESSTAAQKQQKGPSVSALQAQLRAAATSGPSVGSKRRIDDELSLPIRPASTLMLGAIPSRPATGAALGAKASCVPAPSFSSADLFSKRFQALKASSEQDVHAKKFENALSGVGGSRFAALAADASDSDSDSSSSSAEGASKKGRNGSVGHGAAGASSSSSASLQAQLKQQQKAALRVASAAGASVNNVTSHQLQQRHDNQQLDDAMDDGDDAGSDSDGPPEEVTFSAAEQKVKAARPQLVVKKQQKVQSPAEAPVGTGDDGGDPPNPTSPTGSPTAATAASEAAVASLPALPKQSLLTAKQIRTGAVPQGVIPSFLPPKQPKQSKQVKQLNGAASADATASSEAAAEQQQNPTASDAAVADAEHASTDDDASMGSDDGSAGSHTEDGGAGSSDGGEDEDEDGPVAAAAATQPTSTAAGTSAGVKKANPFRSGLETVQMTGKRRADTSFDPSLLAAAGNGLKAAGGASSSTVRPGQTAAVASRLASASSAASATTAAATFGGVGGWDTAIGGWDDDADNAAEASTNAASAGSQKRSRDELDGRQDSHGHAPSQYGGNANKPLWWRDKATGRRGDEVNLPDAEWNDLLDQGRVKKVKSKDNAESAEAMQTIDGKEGNTAFQAALDRRLAQQSADGSGQGYRRGGDANGPRFNPQAANGFGDRDGGSGPSRGRGGFGFGGQPAGGRGGIRPQFGGSGGGRGGSGFRGRGGGGGHRDGGGRGRGGSRGGGPGGFRGGFRGGRKQ